MIFFPALAFGIAVVTVYLVRVLASQLAIVDTPDGDKKRHGRSVPLLGGVALFVAFWVPVIYLVFHPILGIERLTDKLAAAFVGSLILLLVGIADDIKPYSAKWRFIFVVLAILITVLLGGGLEKINNPFGGIVALSTIGGGALVFLWLIGMTFTTKILDGLDGLATGITGIGALVIFFFTQTHTYYQPNVSLTALILAAACFGFLLFNFYPASIFLGESGSMLLGFLLGVLAVVGGGKLAIALLVMALPILDLARVMYVRFRAGQSVMQGDRRHLHFKLVDAGLSIRKAVLIYYALALFFGISTLFLQSVQKVYALALLVVVMVVIMVYSNTLKE